ncbi:MAG: hypothetical protein MUC63_02055 [Planctomycetes bacterium]|nr:hypothetical protein [Planctomycetota bacterium]
MARFDLESWVASPDAVGARFASRDLRGALGLFSSGRLKVPEGVAVLVRPEAGPERLVPTGDEAQGPFEAVAVRTGDHALEFRFPRLLAQGDFPFDVLAEVEVFVDASDPEALRDFAEAFLQARREAGRAELIAALAPRVEESVRKFVASRPADELARGDHSDALEASLRDELKKDLFEAGLSFSGLRRAEVRSEEFGKVLEERLGATVEEERARRQKIAREAKAAEAKDEILSNREVQDLLRKAQHEGALREIELRKEKLLAEKELQKVAEAAAEERLEKDARSVSNLKRVFEEAGLKDFFEKAVAVAREEARGGAKPAGGIDPRLHGVPEGRARRLLCAAGRRVLAFAPRKPAPAEVHDFGSELGMVRSVRVLGGKEGPLLAAGAQFGVWLKPLAGGPPRAFRISGAGANRGGVNAAALHGEALFATHSDFGLLRWALSEPGKSEALRRDLTGGRDTCRAAQVGPLERLFLSAGSEVISLLPESLDGTPTVFAGAPDAVTSVALTQRSLFAGTSGGEVLRWELAEPEAGPRREIAKRPDPVYMLKLCGLQGAPHLLVGSQGYAVLAKALEAEAEVSYPCDLPVRWVDGASDFLFGVEREGRRVYVFEAGNPRARPLEIPVDERVQDLAVWREADPAQGA